MTSTNACSSSPPEIDFSVIRMSIQMREKMVDQILHGVHYGSNEVRGLLQDECDIILECKFCRNMFRSFPNFVAHKRVYCMERYKDKLENDSLSVPVVEEETVVILPEDINITKSKIIETARQQQCVNTENRVFEKVINQTFEGKSKAYQFYTKTAEDVEKKRIDKVTNILTVTQIPTTQNAVIVSHTKSDKSNATFEHFSKPSNRQQSLSKKKNLAEVCTELKKGQILNENETNSNGAANKTNILPSRSRKSFPKKSVDFVIGNDKDKEGNSVDCDTDVDLLEWTNDSQDDETQMISNDNVDDDKEWLKYCDTKKSLCKVCKKQFSSLYSLKFHAKTKHSNSGPQYVCPSCDLTFQYFTSLARHLRNKHHKSERYIDNIKASLNKHVSSEKINVVEETSVGKNTKTASPDKTTVNNLLPCSTGWKKCDKCGKVCWKAKSFYRHYSSCKGLGIKNKKSDEEKISNASSSCIKESVNKNKLNTKAIKIHDNTNESTALTKLPENLSTADLLQSNSLLNDRNKGKVVRNENLIGEPSNRLYDTSNLLDTDRQIRKQIFQKGSEKTDVVNVVNIVHETEEVSHINEGSAREASPKVIVNIAETDSKTNKSYSTMLSSQFIDNLTEYVLLTEDKVIPNAERNEQITRIQEQVTNMQDPEIKRQEESVKLVTKDKLNVDETIIHKQKAIIGEQYAKSVNNSNYVSDDREKSEHENISIRQKDVSKKYISNHDGKLEPLSAEFNARRTRNVSKDGQTSDGKSINVNTSVNKEPEIDTTVQIKATEKIKIDTQLSAFSLVSSPHHPSSLPVSPAVSVHSSSTDVYNLKFKMSVKEMAELVESTSLTKFARERKEKARTLLNKKHNQNSQKAGTSLGKPLKRRLQKRNIFVKKVYSTRHSTNNEEKETLKHDRKYALRKLSKISSVKPDSKTPQSSLQTREWKRLENTAGFVEKNYYAAKAVKYSVENIGDKSIEVKRSRDISFDRNRGISKERNKAQTMDQGKKNKNGNLTESLKDRKDDNSKCEQTSSFDENKNNSNRSIKRKRNVYTENVKENETKVLRKRRCEHYPECVENSIYSDSSSSSKTSSREKKNPAYLIKNPDKVEEDKKDVNTEKNINSKIQIMDSALITDTKATDAKLNDNKKVDNFSMKAKDILIEQKQSEFSAPSNDNLVDHTILLTNQINIDGNITGKKGQNNQAIVENDSANIEDDTGVKMVNLCGKENPDLIVGLPKHRTRLATGSIFFDSQLLKLSPRKVEKKIAQAQIKNMHAYMSVPSDQTVKQQQRSSEKKVYHKPISPRFSLSSGVKQCLKCNKTFWKSKSYRYHLRYTACRESIIQQNVGQKHLLTLSASPKEQISGENQEIIEMETKFKKTKSDSVAYEVALKRTESQNPAEIENSQEEHGKILIIENCVRDEKDTGVDNHIPSEDKSNEYNIEKKQEHSVENSKSHQEMTEIDMEDAATSGINVHVQLGNFICLALSKMSSNDNNNLAMNVTDTKVTLEGEKVTTTQEIHCLPSPSFGTDIDDSDDNLSEFSGFSEDEVKASELELSVVDKKFEPKIHSTAGIEMNKTMGIDKAENLKTMHTGDVEGLETNLKVDLIVIPKKDVKKYSSRPIRKSAQNRFCHVEEIWVYKEPGKPIVERMKNIKNREYVLDAENPLKLHCHNNKDVDKLIDEEKLKCRQCDTPCTSISNLRRHIIRHLGWKRYKCKVCAFACYDMSECRMHMSRSHNEKLTNKNFTRLVYDLKNEATKKRAAKRTNTLRNQKEMEKVSGSDTYKKPRQTVAMKDLNQESTLVKRDNIPEKGENQHSGKVLSPKLTLHKPTLGDFVETEHEKCERQRNAKSHSKSIGSPDSEMVSKLEPNQVQSPLLKARMTLAKALGDK